MYITRNTLLSFFFFFCSTGIGQYKWKQKKGNNCKQKTSNSVWLRAKSDGLTFEPLGPCECSSIFIYSPWKAERKTSDSQLEIHVELELLPWWEYLEVDGVGNVRKCYFSSQLSTFSTLVWYWIRSMQLALIISPYDGEGVST